MTDRRATAMAPFRVLRQWVEEGYVEVDAKTVEEAVEIATTCPLPEEHWPSDRTAESRGALRG
jgi:hypothetical protein